MKLSNQIPEEVIEEIRKANDIVDVVGEYVQLKKQGRNYFGLCPFHGEKTPSFSVTQEKQIFHCFGCGKGGNVVTFLMEIESYSFYESLKILAERAGIALPERTEEKKHSLSDENQSILEAYDWLTKLYHHLLRFTKDGKAGYDYFKDRQINEESIEVFQLGFAPNTKDFIVQFLEKKGYNQQLLIKAGLVSLQDDNQVTDRFRGRVIFPIRNHLGKTVAFGARAINDEQQPKYLNSSESELFTKGNLLYNFDLAKRHIRKENEVILFEGYMDVIASFQAGVKNTVATLGTSLTEFQARLLKRYVNNVVICYDGDSAGEEASYRAANILRKSGCNVKISYLKNGMDPDTFIKEHGGEAFRNQVIRASEAYMTFYMRFARKNFNLSLETERLNYIQKVLTELFTVESSIEREYYLQELSKEFGMSIETMQDEMRQLQQKNGIQDKSEENRYTKSAVKHSDKRRLLPAFHNAERSIIHYMLQHDWVADKVQHEIGARFKVEEHQVIVTHLYAFYEEGNDPDVSKFIEKLNDDKLKQLVTEIIMLSADEEISDAVLQDYIRTIREHTNDKTSIDHLKEQLKVAEQESNPLKAAQILKQIMQIQRKLKSHQ